MLLVHQVQLLKEGYGQEALEMEEIASRIISGAGGEADEVGGISHFFSFTFPLHALYSKICKCMIMYAYGMIVNICKD